MAGRKGMFIPHGGAEMEESTNMRLELFSFVSKGDRCGCQQRNAVNGMGRKGEEDQVSKVEQFFEIEMLGSVL